MYGTKKKEEEEEEKEKKSDRSSKTHKVQKGCNDATGGQKSRGGQKGHKGRTCKPKPTEYETHTQDSCPRYGSGNLSITKILKRNIIKALRKVKVITTSHSINICRCRSCGYNGIESKDCLPNNGSYDPSITTEVADDYAYCILFRMIADRMTRHGLMLFSGTVHNIAQTGSIHGNPCSRYYIHDTQAKMLHIDETSTHLNGRTVWVWILYDPRTEHVLYTIQGSRGADVLNKTLKNCDGITVYDDWSAYRDTASSVAGLT